MEPAEYERMYALEDNYWWFQGRMRIILECLKAHKVLRPGVQILDVGCGTGLMLKKLGKYNPIGVDFSPLSMQYCRRRGASRLLQGDVVKLPFREGSLDLILALDLMEHVERDDLLADEFRRVLRPGGHAMITVPCHPSLWSDHDVALHHFRRYTYRGFKKLLLDHGLRPVKYSYAITATYLPIVAFRKIQRLIQRGKYNASPKAHLIPLPGIVNKGLIKVLEAEAWWLRKRNFSQGISLLCLAERV